VVVVLGLVCRAAGFSLFGLIRYIKEELPLVLRTSFSESAMPLLMEKLERAGCPKPIVGLVVPTGYSFNLDGIGNAVATIVVARWGRAVDLERLRNAFAGRGGDLTDRESDALRIEGRSDVPAG
jgi:Na+/H+-dicarboxylate symporter